MHSAEALHGDFSGLAGHQAGTQKGGTITDRAAAQWRFNGGDGVISAGEKKLGKVIAFLPDMTMLSHLVVQGGMLFHHER